MPQVVTPELAVDIDGLTKIYAPRSRRNGGAPPPRPALNNVALKIPCGAIFGLLGPNGAGKSTLINIMAGLVSKSAGAVRLWGIDIDQAPEQARAAIGVVPQETNIDAFFTPRELLDLQAGLFGVPKAERRTAELLDLIGLADKAEAYARTLSGGMRRRLMVAKAMVHSPPILVLDEPTAGVDIELRHALWDWIRLLNRGGTTVLLTTHYLEEAEQLCDSVAIIARGEIVAADRTRILIDRLDRKELILTLDQDLAAAPAIEGVDAALDGPRRLRLIYQPSSLRADALLARIREAGLGVVDLESRQADLEDVFLDLTRGQR